ncbi:MAG: hypothetical protein ABSD08_01515 [Xanthobacteraceae bacterium]
MTEELLNQNRRNLLQFVAGGIFGVACDVVLKPHIQRGYDSLRYFFDPNRSILDKMDRVDAKNVQFITRMFGAESGNVTKLAGGRDHYLHPLRMHHDNEWACNETIRILQNLSPRLERDFEGDFNVSGSFICCGSPTSNLRTAAFLEYEYVDVRNPRLGFHRKPNAHLDLPIQFELRTRLLREKGLVADQGIDGDATPQWAVRVGDELLPTKVGEHDFLLVSRLPNWIELRSNTNRSTSNIVTIFAGCHGAATGSLHLLFENGDLLDRLDALTTEHTFWQALVGIRHIKSLPHPITDDNRYIALALDPRPIFACPVTIVM